MVISQSRVQAPLWRLSPGQSAAYDKKVVKQKKQQCAVFSATKLQVNNLTVLEKSCGHCKVWVICVLPMCAHETL